MSLSIHKIGDLIEVPPVQTVIRLEDGHDQSNAIADSFVFTAEVRSHFAVLVDALQAEAGRGFFLQGDFGSGKSHFLAALTVWLTGGDGAAALEAAHGGLARLRKTGRRFLPVTISLVDYRGNTPLERILAEAVETTLAEHRRATAFTPLTVFIRALVDLLQNEEAADTFAELAGIDSDDIEYFLATEPREVYTMGVRLYKQLGLAVPEVLIQERRETFEGMLTAVAAADFDGLVLIIDELSEFFRSKPDARALNEDARTLQLLGELSQDHSLWIIAAVQESIERTGDLSQVTFQKIKDRFAVKFALSTVHIRALIAQRLVQKKTGADHILGEIHAYIRRQFPAFHWGLDEFLSVYPVHPATIALLDGLGDLFSAHRGIVDFVHARLAGDPERHVPDILNHPAHELLGPDSIYDHFNQRMAEFSALNVYPRHIIPHLDEVIDTVIDDSDDRTLAHRLVRILVLYEIHPTAKKPTARELATMAACDLAEQDPDLNVQFVIEGILDPVVAASRFLSRIPSKDNDPLNVVFSIQTEADPTHTLKARIARTAAEVPSDDSRLLSTVLAEVPESTAWPGPRLWRQGVFRSIEWQHTSRRVFVSVLPPAFDDTDPKSLVGQQIDDALAAEGADFAVVISLGDTHFSKDHTAVWVIPFPKNDDQIAILREFLAAGEIANSLRLGNPAEAPLIDPARNFLARLSPAAHQAALAAFFSGDFNDPRITVEPVIRQMKRFDRLLDRAGAVLLYDRYPAFGDIAPRKVPPFPRTYQRLLDEFIRPGSISLKKAHTSGIDDAIDGLATPLGLVELKTGSYVFAPDPEHHPLLIDLFTRIRPAGKTPRKDLLRGLCQEKFGLPEETAYFLLAALAHGGLITLLKSDRIQPLELIRHNTIKNIDTVALGEVIGKHDRRTLTTECPFLAPEGRWTSFGLRQQRDAWQATIKFKEKMGKIVAGLKKQLATLADFSTFDAFDRPTLTVRFEAVTTLLDEIKVSYSAREGLERFLTAWRGSGLTAGEIDYLDRLHTFFNRQAEQFVFISHYLRHPAVVAAGEQDPAIEELTDAVASMLANPEVLVRSTSPHRINETFARFKAAWTEYYTAKHQTYNQRVQPKPLSRFARRTMTLLKRLAAVESLDRPTGLEVLFQTLSGKKTPLCRRLPAEELMRAPVCPCGFLPDTPLPAAAAQDPEIMLEDALKEYLAILRAAPIREAISARAYALADSDPERAERLRSLMIVLKEDRLSAAGLLDVLDEASAKEIATALSGRVDIKPKGLNTLFTKLSGRRLAPEQIMETVKSWLTGADSNSIVAIEDDRPNGSGDTLGSKAESTAWWPLLHPSIFDATALTPHKNLEAHLARSYPVGQLSPRLKRLKPDALIRFIVTEPFHTEAVRAAWQWLCQRKLRNANRLAGTNQIPLQTAGHYDRNIAEHIDTRIQILHRLSRWDLINMPAALAGRLDLARIHADLWATAEIKALVLDQMETIAREGEPWLAALPVSPPIDLDDNPVVLILDGVSPDVWLETSNGLTALMDGKETDWGRLDTTPQTASAVAALFGFSDDALDVFDSRQIPYHQVSGDENEPLSDRLPSLPGDRAVVMRMGMVDFGAHTGQLRLEEMPPVVMGFLKRELPWLQSLCRRQSRRLVVTTDHGLSFTAKGLVHGRGGAFEQTIFRVTF